VTDIHSRDSETERRRRREGGRGYSIAANACKDSDASGWIVTSRDFGDCCGLKSRESCARRAQLPKIQDEIDDQVGSEQKARNLIVEKLEQRTQRAEAPGFEVKS